MIALSRIPFVSNPNFRISRVLQYFLLSAVVVLSAVGTVSCGSSKGHHKQKKEYAETGKKTEIKGGKTQKRIVEEAMSWVGTPYAYAKCEKGEGTDCSGMVMKVYETAAGWKIPRNSAKQAEFCIFLEKENVCVGDLVFFATGKDPERISHVGIMIDDINFVHASTSKGVVVSKINTPYYTRTFRMFGRIPSVGRAISENKD